MRRFLLAALVAAFFVPNAYAQTKCYEREALLKALEGQYGETITAMGIISGRAYLEIYTSQAGSWTIVATAPDGPSCVISAGEGWESIEPHYPIEGRDG